MESLPVWAQGEELLNCITHGVMVPVAIAFTVILAKKTLKLKDRPVLIGCLVYGLCQTFLFINSTIYHGSVNIKIKRFLRYLDHCTIFFQIAGTYTPVILTIMRTPLGIGLLIYVWVFTAIGVYIKLFYFDRTFGTFIYLAMGWTICLFFSTVKKSLTKDQLKWLFIGGISYSTGCIFFALQKYVPFMHTIFHLFVSGGAIAHFKTVYMIVQGMIEEKAK